jgi:hypothetical protein
MPDTPSDESRSKGRVVSCSSTQQDEPIERPGWTLFKAWGNVVV